MKSSGEEIGSPEPFTQGRQKGDIWLQVSAEIRNLKPRRSWRSASPRCRSVPCRPNASGLLLREGKYWERKATSTKLSACMGRATERSSQERTASQRKKKIASIMTPTDQLGARQGLTGNIQNAPQVHGRDVPQFLHPLGKEDVADGPEGYCQQHDKKCL